MSKSNPESRLVGLTEEERDFYTWNSRQIELAKKDNDDCPINDKWKRFLKSLAACRASDARKRALLKKHQFCKPEAICPECNFRHYEHTPNCALTAELEGE